MTTAAEIVKTIEQIPPLSQSAARLLTLLCQGNHTVNDMVKILEMDPALTLRMLRTVNSPAYGLRSRIDSLNMAVTYLGENMVMSIAVESGTGGLYRSSLKSYSARNEELWAHSLCTAIGAREIARLSKTINPASAYTAGLLHDIGKPVIDQWLAGSTAKMIEQAHENNEDFHALERKKIQTDHAETGGLLLAKWGLPENLRQAVAFHHCPSKAPEKDRPLTFSVHLGDILSMMAGIGTSADSLLYSMDSGYTAYLNIKPEQTEQIVFDIVQEYQKILKALEN